MEAGVSEKAMEAGVNEKAMEAGASEKGQVLWPRGLVS